MADNNGLFFNSINGDRVYNADSFAEWLQRFFTTGVFNGEMQVTPGSGMMVNVAPGYANINGKVRFFDTMQAFTIDPASGTYPRIDAIMVRLDETARNISTVYVKGDYSGDSPTAPAPVRSEGVYDIVLAHIAVNAGQTAITVANITDTRADDEICGWVTSTVEGVPMDQIVSQMQADFLAWYDRMKDQLSEDAAGHLQAEIDTLSEALTNTTRVVRSHGYDFGPENTGTTATQAFSKGDYFMQDNQFAQATADIAEGDTVELGTNYRATTVGDELEALNNGLIAEEFDLTSSYSGVTGNGTYNSITKEVHMMVVGSTSSNIPMNTTLCTIPEKYRPKAQKKGGMLYSNDSNQIGAYNMIYANENGTITQGASASVRRILAVFNYVIE